MSGSISFPHLGISLQSVPKSFQIFGLEIACYGIVIAVAMVTGLLLVMKIADRTGQNGDDYFDLGIITLIVSVICARLYYVIFSWDYYSQHLQEIINIREGGLAIYGGVIGGAVTVVLFCKKKKLNPVLALDTASLGLVWGQMVGRWGNFFNREAFGGYTDSFLAMQIPVSDVRVGEITEQMQQNLVQIGESSYIRVHPTFLYESLWNVGVMTILLILTLKIKKKYHGVVFLHYFILYGLGRMWIEGLRTDQLLIPGTHLAVSQVLSILLVVVGSGALLSLHFGAKKRSL